MRWILAAVLAASAAAGSFAQEPGGMRPPADEEERSCVLASGNRVRLSLKTEPTDGRIRTMKPDDPAIPLDYRHLAFYEIEVDATNTGMKVTYVFWCTFIGDKWTVFPQGRKSVPLK